MNKIKYSSIKSLEKDISKYHADKPDYFKLNRQQDRFTSLFIILSLFLIVAVILLAGCTDTEAQEPKPLNNKFRCSSKLSGSTPACWNDQDWEAFCERVRCKTDKDDCWREYTDCELYDNPRPENK